MSERAYGILLAGVGGQEAELAGELIARAAIEAGLEATLSTERPPSRHGGSAVCRVRIARGEIRTPFISPGEADLLLGLEGLESLRRIHEVRADGLAVVADRIVPTPRMRAGLEEPPADIPGRLRQAVARVVLLPLEAIFPVPREPAALAGAFLGVAACLLPIPAAAWDATAAREGIAWLEGLALGRRFFEAQPEDVRCPLAPRAA
ncbi:MAG: 2-oxoacid:acceptor oxidoreductase family protein [Deltaproteobacteria bacterium]|nr:2-oxoacid:acceptor oxidoreductase family protein [Deltaproteobacteria bacterium]